MGYARLIGGVVVAAVVACAGVAVGQIEGLVVRDLRQQSGTTYNVFVAPSISPNGQHLTYGVMQITRSGSFTYPTIGSNQSGQAVDSATSTLDTVWRIGTDGVPTLVLGRAAGQAVEWPVTPGQPVRVSSLAHPIVDNQGRVATRATLAVPRGQISSDFYPAIVETSGGISRAAIWEAPRLANNFGTGASTSWSGSVAPERWVGGEFWGRSADSVFAVASGTTGPIRTVTQGAVNQRVVSTTSTGSVFLAINGGTITRVDPTTASSSVVAAQGATIPGQPTGTTYFFVGAPQYQSATISTTLNGAAVFRAYAQPSPSPARESIWLSNGTTARRVATHGDAVPGLPGASIAVSGTTITNAAAFGALDLPGGQTGAAFFAGVDGPSQLGTGLFLNTPAGTSLIARTDTAMPVGTGGRAVTIARFFAAFFNTRGQAIIYAQLRGLGYSAIFTFDPEAGLAMLPDTMTLTTGEVVPVGYNVSGVMAQLGLPSLGFVYNNTIVTTGSSLTSPIADDGSFALAAFWPGNSAIVTGFIPAPSAAGIIMLAGCVAMRRRRVG